MPTQVETADVPPIGHRFSMFLTGAALCAAAMLWHHVARPRRSRRRAHRLQHGELRFPRSAHHPRQPDVRRRNFVPVVDGFGNARKFYVHIPAAYDAVDGEARKVPLIFAFHGGGSQTPEAMITGKWEEYFDQDYAFVIPLAGADPCDNPGGNGKSHWMQAGMALRTSPADANCDPATEVVNGEGKRAPTGIVAAGDVHRRAVRRGSARHAAGEVPQAERGQGLRHRLFLRRRHDLHAGVLPRVALPRFQRSRKNARQRERPRRHRQGRDDRRGSREPGGDVRQEREGRRPRHGHHGA